MASASSPASPTSTSLARIIRRAILWGALAVTVVICGIYYHAMSVANAARDKIPETMAHSMGIVDIDAVQKTLAKPFTDKQQRLLADPPASTSELLDPKVLVLAHINSSDPESPSIPWRQFADHLAAATGRELRECDYDNSPDQLADIKDGKITLVALHAAETPFLVNNYGYQPVAVLSDDGGAIGNHLDVIVPSRSSIGGLGDLRQRSLVCTLPTSITGYRAAVAILLHDHKLRPNVDYNITWSTGQKKSIAGIAKKSYEAAAVSDDKLQSMLRKGQISTADYRVIYQSEVIPRTTIGWFYNLKPELAGKLREAILSFRPKDASAAKDHSDADGGESSGGKSLHFVAVDYKSDFKMIRAIDDGFDPRFNLRALKPMKPAATATTVP